MPRRPRHYLPGLPYHIVQRGNNRQPVFFERNDYLTYLQQWQSISAHHHDQVHAYCLMTNHIHFLVTAFSEKSLSKTLQIVSARYARYINKKYRRTGSLWEGRHRSSLVDSEEYFFTCMRYIEMNPVRAELCALPEHYEWSSFVDNTNCCPSWITPHDEYLRLGLTAETRSAAYKNLFQVVLKNREIQIIQHATRFSHVVGTQTFIDKIEKLHGISLGQNNHGRPTTESIT